jgi:hypothetical protein
MPVEIFRDLSLAIVARILKGGGHR